MGQFYWTKSKKSHRINNRYLRHLIQIVIFCGRKNVALRGHRNDGMMNYESHHKEILSGKQGIYCSL